MLNLKKFFMTAIDPSGHRSKDRGSNGSGPGARLKPAVFLGLGLMCLSGCSYISTLDPNDNARLEQLKLERQAMAAEEKPALSLPALRQRIDELRSPRLIFRTKTGADKVLIEAFSGEAEVRAVIAAALAEDPALLERIEVTSGVRGPDDELPPGIKRADPEGLDLMIAEWASWGPSLWVSETYLGERAGAPEDLYHALTGLVLVKDPAPIPLEKAMYQIELREEKGPYIASLTLDRDQRLEVVQADGTTRTYSILSTTQYSELANFFHVVLYDFQIRKQLDSFVEPEPEPVPEGMEFPYTDPGVVIGRDFMELTREDELEKQSIVMEMGLVGYADPPNERSAIVGRPKEQLSIVHFVLTRENPETEWSVGSSQVIAEDRANELAREWELGDTAVADALALLRSKTWYSFLNWAQGSGYQLDPSVDWRQLCFE